MKKYLYIIIMCIASLTEAWAQEVFLVHHTDGQVRGAHIQKIDSIRFTDGCTITQLHMADTLVQLPNASIDSLSFGHEKNVVRIHYDGSTVSTVNPMAYQGVDVVISESDVVVTSTTDEEIEYILTGTAADGMFKVYSNKKFVLTLAGVSLTNADGSAINIQTGKKTTINLLSGTVNVLADGTSYAETEADEDQKGTLFSEGQLIFMGEGTLQVIANYNHGICSDDYIEIESGTFQLFDIAGDALHANDYIQIKGGLLNISASKDAIDGDAGSLQIQGGEIVIDMAGDATRGLKADAGINISGGKIHITASGGVLLENNDPTYCSGIRTDGDCTISGGEVTIVHTGEAGRGISANGSISVLGGTLDISTSGSGGTYTNISGTKDSYSAACIKADGNIQILAGEVKTVSTGKAGKGISTDGMLTIGDVANCPIVFVGTSGAKLTISGSGENANCANPKAIKSEGTMTINNGNITVTTSQDGGEGLESKDSVIINGGVLEIETYDDAINATNHLQINGGRIYCNATGNDGIDSNGTLAMAGGLLITSGVGTPEEGVDCDQNRFAVTGGVLIGTGGATSTPTASACTQCCVVYGSSNLTNKLIYIEDTSGNGVITYLIPNKSVLNRQITILLSSDKLVKSASYTLYTGGSVTGGEEFHGYYINGIYSNGTSVKNFTTSNMVTTVGSTSSGPGGGNRPW